MKNSLIFSKHILSKTVVFFANMLTYFRTSYNNSVVTKPGITVELNP